MWQAYSVLWLLGAYTELVKLLSARVNAQTRAAYYAETASLKLVGGGFAEFEALAQRVERVIEAGNLTDEEKASQVKALLSQTSWLPQAYKDVLEGKTYLPRHKLRAGLLQRDAGFMGFGAYRQHFFAKTGVLDLLSNLRISEKVRYSRVRAAKSRA